MSQLSNSEAFSQAYLKFKTVLSDVSDPKGKSKYIYGSFPILLIDKRASYPLIVIEPVTISSDALTFTNAKKGPLQVTVDVFATNTEDLDSMSDDIAKTMYDNDSSFTISGVTNMSLVSSSYSNFSRDRLHIHNRKFIYEFDYWWF